MTMNEGPRHGEKVPVAYVTKWALTQGILVFRDLELSQDGRDDSPVYLHIDWRKMGAYGWRGSLFLGAREWSPTLEEAKARVAAMVASKLKSIEKQKAKLLKFEPKVVDKAVKA